MNKFSFFIQEQSPALDSFSSEINLLHFELSGSRDTNRIAVVNVTIFKIGFIKLPRNYKTSLLIGKGSFRC